MELKENSVHEQYLTVSPDMSAIKVGSGVVDVFATPSMIAFIEKTCCDAITPTLEPNKVSVGAEINVKHVAPSKIGAKVKCVARVLKIEKNRVLFTAVVIDNDKIVGTASHTRCIVDKDKFLAKVK